MNKSGKEILEGKEKYYSAIQNMTNDQKAKNLLTNMTCDNCKYNGLKRSINFTKIPECHYWLMTQRGSELALNLPFLPDNNYCDKWKKDE